MVSEERETIINKGSGAKYLSLCKKKCGLPLNHMEVR